MWMEKIDLSDSDRVAFQKWQQLPDDKKNALLWMAENHNVIMNVVRAYTWIVQSSAIITKVGALSAAVLGILALYRHFTGSNG